MVTHQITHSKQRGEQLSKIQEMRPEIPRDPGEASKFLLFEYYDTILTKDNVSYVHPK